MVSASQLYHSYVIIALNMSEHLFIIIGWRYRSLFVKTIVKGMIHSIRKNERFMDRRGNVYRRKVKREKKIGNEDG